MLVSQEKRAYYNHDVAHNMKDFKNKYNNKVKILVYQSYRSYYQSGNVAVFDKYFLVGGVLVTKTDEDKLLINPPFDTC